MKKILEGILGRELDKLEKKSQVEDLDMDDLKKVEILTRSLKQIEVSEKAEDELESLTIEQLIELANLSKDGHE
jgi:hypothetical protein